MNHCLRFFLLLIPSLIAIGLLAVSFGTNWWTIPIEKNIPHETFSHVTNDSRLYSALIPLTVTRGVFSECIAYRKVNILVAKWYSFRDELTAEEKFKLTHENCTDRQFKCVKGAAISRPLTRCIDRQRQCNGIIDCEDKSDELLCVHQSQISSNCSSDFVKCPDGRTCYRKDDQTCDGVSNCLDDSDEKDCDQQKCFRNNHVYCPAEKKCAQRDNSYRCDGIVDCEDNSDEEGCEKCNGQTDTFLCDAKCFLRKYQCDGIVHCSDFSDELQCGDEYHRPSNQQGNIYSTDRSCEEKRFNPFTIHPPKIESTFLDAYTHANHRLDYTNLIHYLRVIVFWSIAMGLILLFLSILTLFFSICCRHKCKHFPYYLHGVWTLIALVFICIGLVSFINMWIWRKEILLDYERNSPFDTMIHERNPSLQYLEFFGLSFWLACGAALATFIGLILSCCVCCKIGSSRSDNKEYEIMHMQNY